jgi:hypothetical protein
MRYEATSHVFGQRLDVVGQIALRQADGVDHETAALRVTAHVAAIARAVERTSRSMVCFV